MGEWFKLDEGLKQYITKQSKQGQTPEEFIAEAVGYGSEGLGSVEKD